MQIIGGRNSGYRHWPGRKPDVPQRLAQMAPFNGEIMDLSSSRSPREEEEVSLLGRS